MNSQRGLNDMKERRKKNDRRGYAKPNSGACGHSRFPDRRLNNISVEWIPLGLVHSHPLTHRVFEVTRRVFTRIENREAVDHGSPGDSH
jgi:hypothetical protein